MTLRRVLMLLASLGLGCLLLLLLLRLGKIDLRTTLLQLKSVSLGSFAVLVLLNVLLLALSTAKWRGIDAVLRRPADPVPPRAVSFALTAAGMALGLVLPVQFGMTAARTLGTHFYGSALKRGGAGTLFEQSFDLLIVLFLAAASAFTRYRGGGGAMWALAAAAMVALALLAVGPALQLLRWLAGMAGRGEEGAVAGSRIAALRQGLAELAHSELLRAPLARRLVALSALRFLVVAMMAEQTARAIGAPIPLWQMAAMVPFVVAATVLAITPGGVGVNELTSVTALHLFGTPLAVAAQWSIANRVLCTAACFAVAAGAALVVAVQQPAPSKTAEAKSKAANGPA